MKVFYFHDEVIDEEALLAGLHLAKEQAQKGAKHISIFVNVISGNVTDQLMQKMFSQTEGSKLRAGKTIMSDGVSIKLESAKTFGSYKEYELVLGLHLSTRNLELVENNKSVKKLILFVETQDLNHEWLAKVNAKHLTYKQT